MAEHRSVGDGSDDVAGVRDPGGASIRGAVELHDVRVVRAFGGKVLADLTESGSPGDPHHHVAVEERRQQASGKGCDLFESLEISYQFRHGHHVGAHSVPFRELAFDARSLAVRGADLDLDETRGARVGDQSGDGGSGHPHVAADGSHGLVLEVVEACGLNCVGDARVRRIGGSGVRSGSFHGFVLSARTCKSIEPNLIRVGPGRGARSRKVPEVCLLPALRCANGAFAHMCTSYA